MKARFALPICTLLGALASANAQTPTAFKRDIRGFSLGMDIRDFDALARRQCLNNFCGSVNAKYLCAPVKSLREMYRGGSGYDFSDPNTQGTSFDCPMNGLTITSSIAPTIKEIYRLHVTIPSRANCEEMLSYMQSNFHLGSNYVVDFPKENSHYKCDGIRWNERGIIYRLMPSFENTFFQINIEDRDIINQDNTVAEIRRKTYVAKPPL